jgi:glycosyltransferase involved in cell wall biosynthesis
MQAVKDQPTLARAFVQMVQTLGEHARHARLVMVGDGPLRAQVQAIVDEAGLSQRVWLPGERQDVADVMRALSCFALPSRAEGISNTILEAMASGLPVVATRVGGNAELVSEGRTGHLVPPGDPAALATALAELMTEPRRSMTMGQQARDVAERQFSLQAMVARYQAVYDRQLRLARRD